MIYIYNQGYIYKYKGKCWSTSSKNRCSWCSSCLTSASSHRHTLQWALHNSIPNSRIYTAEKYPEQQIYAVRDTHESCHLKSYWITSIRENCSLKKRSEEFIETNPSIFIRAFSTATEPLAINSSPPKNSSMGLALSAGTRAAEHYK